MISLISTIHFTIHFKGYPPKNHVAQPGQPPISSGLDLEKLVVQLGQSERGAQGELLRAQEREQLSRVPGASKKVPKGAFLGFDGI